MKKVDNSIFDDEFQSNLDKLKTILRSRDLSFVDNNESKTVAMYLKKTLSTIQESIFFSSDITFNKKYEDLRDKLKEYGNKVQTMRNTMTMTLIYLMILVYIKVNQNKKFLRN